MKIGAQRIGELKKEDRIEVRRAQIMTETNRKDPMEQLLESGRARIRGTIEKQEREASNIFATEIQIGSKTVEAVFKPCGDDHGISCMCSREKAASITDKILGFNLVPTTVVREISSPNHGVDNIGSLQLFDYGEVADDAQLEDDNESKMALRIFDYVIWNYDRHDWNYLVKSDGQTIAIDNELAFGGEDNDWARKEIITDIEDIADKKLPQKVIEIFEKIENDPTIKSKLRRSLREYLDNEKINAMLSRIDKITPLILQNGEIPSDEKTLNTLTYN